MANLTQYLILIFCFGNLLLLLTILSYKTALEKEKSRPFECGFDCSGIPRLPFCMKFFLVGVIFLIFDVEVSLLTPLPFGQTYILLFILILIMGLAYE